MIRCWKTVRTEAMRSRRLCLFFKRATMMLSTLPDRQVNKSAEIWASRGYHFTSENENTNDWMSDWNSRKVTVRLERKWQMRVLALLSLSLGRRGSILRVSIFMPWTMRQGMIVVFECLMGMFHILHKRKTASCASRYMFIIIIYNYNYYYYYYYVCSRGSDENEIVEHMWHIWDRQLSFGHTL